MAYQTKVPVRIPPNEDTELAHKLTSKLPKDFLATAYDVPRRGHGVTVFGPTRRISGRPQYVDITQNDTQVTITPICVRRPVLDQIAAAVRKCTDLPVHIQGIN